MRGGRIVAVKRNRETMSWEGKFPCTCNHVALSASSNTSAQGLQPTEPTIQYPLLHSQAHGNSAGPPAVGAATAAHRPYAGSPIHGLQLLLSAETLKPAPHAQGQDGEATPEPV